MRPIIMKTGTTSESLRVVRGDYDQWFADGFGWPLSRFEVIQATDSPPLPDPRGVDGVIVTGSPLTVHDHLPWSVRLGQWLVEAIAAGVPVLGVCYGHQLIGDALGGVVGRNPRGREIGVVEVEVEPDPLFDGLPSRFPVVITHSDAVNEAPGRARILAGNAHTPVQAMAVGARCRTVQWHPEFDAHIIRHLITERAPQIDAETEPGRAAALHAAVVGVHTGPLILRNFLENFLLA